MHTPETYTQSCSTIADPKMLLRVLTEPEWVKKWIYDDVISVVRRDNEIIMQGWMHGKAFVNRMKFLDGSVDRLVYSQWSSLSGWEDDEASRTRVKFDLSHPGSIHLCQRGFKSYEEYAHVRFYWQVTLAMIVRIAESL